MMTTGKTGGRSRARIGITALVVLGLMAVLAICLLAARGRGLTRSLLSLARAVSNSRTVSSYSRGKFTNVIFLHHSTGRNLIEQGHVREKLTAAGYNLWDHDYNDPGLRDPAGNFTGYSYNVPDDNTDPDGLSRIFAQRVYPVPLNTFSGLLQHEVIVFKSCFPTSNITSDQQLEQDQTWYLGMRQVMDQRPDRLFIMVTQPPLNPAETTPEVAARARALANWLTSEFLSGHPNVFAFDFFGRLAEEAPASPDYGMLRQAYRDGADSHPNRAANETIGPLLADFIVNSVKSRQ